MRKYTLTPSSVSIIYFNILLFFLWIHFSIQVSSIHLEELLERFWGLFFRNVLSPSSPLLSSWVSHHTCICMLQLLPQVFKISLFFLSYFPVFPSELIIFLWTQFFSTVILCYWVHYCAFQPCSSCFFFKIVSSSLLFKKSKSWAIFKSTYASALTFCRNICVYFKMFVFKSKIWEGKSLVFLLMCASQVPVSLSVTLCFDCVKVYILHHIFYQLCVFTQRTIFLDSFYLCLHGFADFRAWSASPTWLTLSLVTDELHSSKQCCIQRLGRSPWCSKSIKVPSC